MTVPAATPRVLIVDDNRIFADTLVSALRSNGVDAKAAYSGSEGIESALESHPDLIVMDVIMDGIDGVDAAIAICETAPVPRILLTSGHENARRWLAKGSARGHDFELVMKPIQLAWLLQRLRGSDGNQHFRGTNQAA